MTHLFFFGINMLLPKNEREGEWGGVGGGGVGVAGI